MGAGDEWRFHLGRDLKTRFHGGDPAVDDKSNRDTPQAHADHLAHADRGIGNACAQPNPKEIEKDDGENKSKDRDDRDADKIKRIHKC